MTALARGDRIGRYEVVSSLGAGGMGEVYLARDTELDRRVALKLLPAAHTHDPDRLQRFVQEARAASALNHPNILTVHEIGHTGERHFIAMEFVDGRTLRSAIAAGPMTPTAAIDVAIQVAEALAAAHAAGVVHRDVKPENLMLRPDGYVKVLDFGLAKLTEPPPGHDAAPTRLSTELGVVMGTVQYMSPEQARGLKVDGRTDTFSLGVVLYELVAGQPPFTGRNSLEVAAAVLNDEPRPLTSRLGAVPPELDRIVARALRKEREQRYQTADELAGDLRRLRHDLNTRAALSRVNAGTPPPARSTLRRRALGAVAAVLLLAAAVAYVTLGRRDAIDSVAVLPFAHMNDAPDSEYLADGITESIINDLSPLAGLRVMSRSSVFRYKGRSIDPQSVGRELNVRAVLTGHVQPQGDDIVIGLELVDVRDGRQLWGAQYRRKAGDLVQAQEDISRAVSERLRLRLTGADADHLNEAPTTNGEAYQLYLKGRFAWRQLTEEGLTRSIEYFLQAVQKDPDYALAYSGLADAYIALGSDALPPHEAMPKAAAYARKALALDPDLVDAQVAVGIVKLIYDWDWPGAEAALRFDRVLTSSSVDAFSCSLHYADVMGRNREMIEALHGALATDPVSLRINLELGCASYYGRQYDQAIRQFQGTLTLYPDHPVASWEIGRAYGQKQMHADAIAALQKVKGSSGDWPPIVSELAYVHARSGRRREALARLNELTEQSARRFVDPYLFAAVHAGLGETDQTFLWLDKAVAARSGWIPWLKIEPKWDGIRSDSRFAALLQRVGLPH